MAYNVLKDGDFYPKGSDEYNAIRQYPKSNIDPFFISNGVCISPDDMDAVKDHFNTIAECDAWYEKHKNSNISPNRSRDESNTLANVGIAALAVGAISLLGYGIYRYFKKDDTEIIESDSVKETKPKSSFEIQAEEGFNHYFKSDTPSEVSVEDITACFKSLGKSIK